MKNIYLAVVMVGLVALSGCTGNVMESSTTSSGPGQVLLAQADTHRAQGDIAKAIALVERAVRIEPRNGAAWYRLAELHYELGNIDKAQQFARRALQFAAPNSQLREDVEKLISTMEEKQGS